MKIHAQRFIITLALLAGLQNTFAQGTAFTYQGRLNDGTNPATGSYDLRFTIYDSLSNPGGVIAGPLTNSATGITNGVFTSTLDFGTGVFTGPDRWLEIAARTNIGGTGAFAALSPRQKLTPTPYAITAGNLTGIVPNAGIGGTYTGAVTFNNTANSFAGNGGGLTNVNAATLGGFGYCSLPCYWNLSGNAGTSPTINFVGTTDNQALRFKVNNTIALQFSPGTTIPNVVGGLAAFRPTFITAGVSGAVVAGGNAPSGGVTGVGGGDFMAVYDNDGAIGGGFGNKVGSNNGDITDGAFATVAGGVFNGAANYAATVAGGDGNLASGQRSFVGGGFGNVASGDFSVLVGGIQSSATRYAAMAMGHNAKATNGCAFAAGTNTVAGGVASVALGSGSIATGDNSIAIGFNNSAVNEWCTAFGLSCTASGQASTAFGDYSVASGFDAVAMGNGCSASGLASVALGSNCDASGDNGMAFGVNNIASGQNSTALGFQTTASGGFGSMSMGLGSKAIGDTSTCIGQYSQATGPASIAMGSYCLATGENSIAMGWSTVTSNRFSMAAGTYASAVHMGSFVWADAQNAGFSSTASNQVSFRCLGGVRFTSGSGAANQTVSWAPGAGAWTFSSDRNLKEQFEAVNSTAVLEKVASLPITEWNYKGYAQRHIGVMAQDFHAAFPLNESTTTLNETDLHGVELAAIQGLNHKVEQQAKTIEAKDARIADLEQRLSRIEKMISFSAEKR